MSTTGSLISGVIDNEVAKSIGNNLQNTGNVLRSSSNAINDTLNAPQNVFKGYAKKFTGNAAAKLGQYLSNKTGVANTIGQGLTSLGSSLGGGTAAGGTAAGGTAAAGAAALGPAAIAAIGAMVLGGKNRKQARKNSEAAVRASNQAVSQSAEDALSQTQQFAESMQNEDVRNYQDYLRQNGYSNDVINGIPQGLNSGHKEIAEWINQFNNGAGKTSPIRIPTTQEDIEKARAGNFNVPTQIGGIEENKEVKSGILNNLLNGIRDFSQGYQENRTQGFSPENLEPNDKKNRMTRLGEVFGTGARMMQNPLMQGLVAGGLSTAFTGDPLYGLGQGYKFANNRQMSNIYQKALKDRGIEVSPNTFGNVEREDFDSIMTPIYKQWENELRKTYYDTLADYRAGMLGNAERKAEIDANYKKEKLAIDKKNSESNAIRARKTGSNNSKNYDTAEFNKNLGYFQKLLYSGDVDSINKADALMIGAYGKDWLDARKKLGLKK